jgi:DNA-binding NtrC family response regulator
MADINVPLRVLVVEDDEQLRQIISSVIASEGRYIVSQSESGEDAIQKFKDEQFDVVLLDYKMPGMSGLNVLQWMHEQKMETPVLMVTGAGSEIVAVESMKLGAYDYVRKEQLDIEHLPIIINGVHERYLFKKEKERRSLLEEERDRDFRAIGEFRDMVTSVTQIMDSALGKMSETIDKYPEDAPEMRQYQSVISFGMRSILDSASTLCDRLLSERKPETGSVPAPPAPKKAVKSTRT